jgi:valyl-tRNA synthetase
MEVPKDYDPLEVEPKWQRRWSELDIYRFKREDTKTPTYVIDTPPPYPSGEFHMGTAFNWTYFDIVARYKRMRGFNVLFPQGWDCHGLPTEVQVEKRYGIRKGDIPPEKFRELCIKLTEENIAHMREEMNSLGFSMDWSTEYRTMDPSYYSKTQLSFVQLYKKGLIYRGEHPVNWCPRCETAIADAEVEYDDRDSSLNYIKFKIVGEDDFITIATTRPEYLHACVVVAVHPDDQRYKKYVGKKLQVPVFGQVVEIIEDREVDPQFGTGVVMICTFGDKTDVRWAMRYKLPVIKAIDERGRMSKAAGEYAGLPLEECKKLVLKKIEASGLLSKQERLKQSVGVCWRCKTPVEILSKQQWFMRVLALKDDAIEGAKRVRWVPEHMRARLIAWAESMDWDWVISRQRIFATPIPVWYCSKCGSPVVADESQLPVDPSKDKPPKNCQKCGSYEFVPETDVLDTWMDSSLTILAHAGWPELDRRLFPADLQPNGTDIIRTWDYYLLVRTLALVGEVPYKTVLINGMVLGTDGRAMHKSLGNYVDTTKARERYGADALRQWAAIGASTGSDIPFAWKDVEFGYKFMRKFWNAARFASPHFKGLDIATIEPSKLAFRPTDKWILSRMNRLVKEVTSYLEDFQFNRALIAIQTFIWHEFCDMYIEEVKHRLYGEDLTAEAAKFTLYKIILTAAKLLAPFIPHFAEEIYHNYFASNYAQPSIHLSEWPVANDMFIDEAAEKLGKIINLVVSAIRQFKSEKGMALSAELPSVEIYAADEKNAKLLEQAMDDIRGTMKIRELLVTTEKPKVVERVLSIEPNFAKIGPRLRSDARAVMRAISEADPEDVARKLEMGELILTVNGKKFTIDREDVKVIRETASAGHKVEIIDISEPVLKILIRMP